MEFVSWIIGALKGVIGLIPLLRRPDLALEVIEATPEPYLLESFRIRLKNQGNKSAEEVKVGLLTHQGSGLEMRPNQSQVEIIDRDPIARGVFFVYPEWEGPEQLWRLTQISLHPHENVTIGTVLVHPEWPGWEGWKWTFIKWQILAKDSKKISGKVQIPVGGSASDIWVSRD